MSNTCENCDYCNYSLIDGKLRTYCNSKQKTTDLKETCDNFRNNITDKSLIKDLRINILTLLTNGKRREATETIVFWILENYSIKTTRDDERSEMWIYNEGIYKADGKTYIKELCRKLLGDAYAIPVVNEIIAKIETDTYVNQEEFFNAPEKHKHLIAVNNGLLNLHTRELIKYNPKVIFFNKIPIMYDNKATCTKIQSFLEQVLSGVDDIKVILELFGYLLLRDNPLEKAVMLTASGRNGKTKLMNIMKYFVGIENCAAFAGVDVSTNQIGTLSLSLNKTTL